jgi:hypothetical protein
MGLLFMIFSNPVLFSITGWWGFSECLVVFLSECSSRCQLEGNLEIVIVLHGLLLWDSACLIFVAGRRGSTKRVVVFRAACSAKRQREKLRGWQHGP